MRVATHENSEHEYVSILCGLIPGGWLANYPAKCCVSGSKHVP